MDNEAKAKALYDIESSEEAKTWLRQGMNVKVNELMHLSGKKVLELEEITHIKIEIPYQPRGKSDIKTLKHKTLVNFINLRPFLFVDRVKPYESILEVIKLYKLGIDEGLTMVIHADGTIAQVAVDSE